MIKTMRRSVSRPVVPKARLKDVAAAAKVSMATASMALADHPRVNHETKSRVRQVSRKLGYRRADVSAGVYRFGLLLVGMNHVQHDNNMALVYNLSSQAMNMGARIEFGSVALSDDAANSVEQVTRFCEGLNGVLLCGSVNADDLIMSCIRDAHIPHVMLGHMMGPICTLGDQAMTTVALDDVGMGYTATRWLLDNGHRRIAFIGEVALPGLQHDRWRKGYQLAHLEAGVVPDSCLTAMTGRTESGAEPIVDNLLLLGQPPTAYVVPDTRIAASLMTSLQRRDIELPHDAIVFASVDSATGAMGLDAYPRLVGRADLLAEHALDQLQRHCQHPRAEAVEVHVPFNTVNMSRPLKKGPLIEV